MSDNRDKVVSLFSEEFGYTPGERAADLLFSQCLDGENVSNSKINNLLVKISQQEDLNNLTDAKVFNILGPPLPLQDDHPRPRVETLNVHNPKTVFQWDDRASTFVLRPAPTPVHFPTAEEVFTMDWQPYYRALEAVRTHPDFVWWSDARDSLSNAKIVHSVESCLGHDDAVCVFGTLTYRSSELDGYAYRWHLENPTMSIKLVLKDTLFEGAYYTDGHVVLIRGRMRGKELDARSVDHPPPGNGVLDFKRFCKRFDVPSHSPGPPLRGWVVCGDVDSSSLGHLEEVVKEMSGEIQGMIIGGPFTESPNAILRLLMKYSKSLEGVSVVIVPDSKDVTYTVPPQLPIDASSDPDMIDAVLKEGIDLQFASNPCRIWVQGNLITVFRHKLIWDIFADGNALHNKFIANPSSEFLATEIPRLIIRQKSLLPVSPAARPCAPKKVYDHDATPIYGLFLLLDDCQPYCARTEKAVFCCPGSLAAGDWAMYDPNKLDVEMFGAADDTGGDVDDADDA